MTATSAPHPLSKGPRGPVRVLYSFPHKLGAGRICEIALRQVEGVASAGGSVTSYVGSLARGVQTPLSTRTTLAFGPFRIPYRAIGTLRACALHDQLVARQLQKKAGEVDVVHAWPLAARATLRVARRLGIPSVLERPNSHTRSAYRLVQQECERVGVTLPPGSEHSYSDDVLRIEEEEYQLADYLLCPSTFVEQSFLLEGFPHRKLIRHRYGYDDQRFNAEGRTSSDVRRGLTVLFAGYCAVRKGLHVALEAWLQSTASVSGTFLIAGDFLPAYAHMLRDALLHPSVKVLGHRRDVPDLMRMSDVMVLPSFEEGSPLICFEALASGCVPLVSDVCLDPCEHMTNALVHPVGDSARLREQFTLLDEDRDLLARLKRAGLAIAPRLTWDEAGRTLLDAYETACGTRLGTAQE